MNHAFHIDTLAFAQKLKAAGADEALATAIVEGITGADTSELATKSDIAGVRSEIKELEYRLTAKFGAMLAVAVGLIAAIEKLL